MNLEGANRLLALIEGDDLTASFPRITPPVLLVLGRSDFSAPPELWEGEWQMLPNCTRMVFEQSGHGPMFEEQEAFDTRLVEWLASH